MKRPFALIGFTVFGILLLLSFSDSNAVAYCVFFVSASIGAATLFKKNLRQAMTVPVCLFTATAACLLFLSFNTQKQTVQTLTGASVRVEGTVAEAPYSGNINGRYYCVLELISVDGKKAKGRLRLSFSPEKDNIDEKELEIGNGISFTGKVYIPGKAKKSISRYFTGESIFLGAYGAKDIHITRPTVKSIRFYFQRLRCFVTDKLRYGFGDRIAGLLVGILTGDKSCLDDGLYEAFRQTGIAHLMAVSGLHLSLWVFSLGSVITQKKKTERLRTLLLMSAVIFIMLLAGMSESVKRAGFMCLVYLSGKLIRKDSDSLNSLGFAVLVILLYNPAAVLSVSLQLSFLSTLGILTLGKLCLERSETIIGSKSINTPVKKLFRFVSDMFIISISVLVFTLPVLVYSFGGFSSVSAFVNTLISPVVTPLLILSGLCVLLSPLSFIAYPLMLTVRLLSEYIILIASFFSSIKNAFVLINAENTGLLLAAASLIITFGIILIPER